MLDSNLGLDMESMMMILDDFLLGTILDRLDLHPVISVVRFNDVPE